MPGYLGGKEKDEKNTNTDFFTYQQITIYLHCVTYYVF